MGTDSDVNQKPDFHHHWEVRGLTSPREEPGSLLDETGANPFWIVAPYEVLVSPVLSTTQGHLL